MALRELSLVLPVLLIFTVAMNTATKDTWAARNHKTARIIDGKPAVLGQFPHQAYIYAEQNKGSRKKHCSGSLVSQRALMTQAWCVYGMAKWTIRLGGIHRTEYEETAWTTVSTWAVMHPDYVYGLHEHKVAIIYLFEKPPLNDYIKLVALPSSAEANSHYMLQDCVISGWGQTQLTGTDNQEILQWTNVMVVPNEICKTMYNTTFDSEKILCAGRENPGVYLGDDGGGLLMRTRNGYKQIGILIQYTTSIPQTETRPAFYTKVAPYIDWIKMKASISDY